MEAEYPPTLFLFIKETIDKIVDTRLSKGKCKTRKKNL